MLSLQIYIGLDYITHFKVVAMTRTEISLMTHLPKLVLLMDAKRDGTRVPTNQDLIQLRI